MEYDEQLIRVLINEPKETPWLEFKLNLNKPDEIGQYISALANAAAAENKEFAYLIWGIDDSTHEIKGTVFNPFTFKIGNEELENWLHHLLSPNAVFEYNLIVLDDKQVAFFKIQRAVQTPVTFKKEAYIRSGTYTRPLKDVPALEIKLWNKLSLSKFEILSAKENLSASQVLEAIHYTKYFDLTKIPLPLETEQILYYLMQDSLVKKEDNGNYSITNAGALLFAKDLSDFPSLARKKLRIISYADKSRISIKSEVVIDGGYASSFEEIIRCIGLLLPKSEIMHQGIRTLHNHYPEIVVRELAANSLIHQDFLVSGAGPVFEIFDRRFEITNPGVPLIDIDRIIDNPPKSRNEVIAALMRRFHICEELGSGWDKIAEACECGNLPAPRIFIYDEATRVVVYDYLPFADISVEDKMWACYLHACLRFTAGNAVSNASLRERFGVDAAGKAKISRLIKSAVEKNFIKPLNCDAAPRYMQYVPYWA